MGFTGNRLDPVQGFWEGWLWFRLCRPASYRSTVYKSANRLGSCAADLRTEGKVQPGRRNRTGGKHLLSLAGKGIPTCFSLPIICEGLGFND